MDNYLAIPEGNPLLYYDKDRALLPQYNIKFDDEFPDPENRKLWEGAGNYRQIWQSNDIIRLQFMSNVAPMTFNLYDCRGIRRLTLNFDQVRRNRYNPELFVYHIAASLAGLEGVYRSEVTVGDPVIEVIETGYMWIKERWPHSALIEYSNSFYYADTIWALDYAPSFRVEGWFKNEAPSSKDELYTDTNQNQRMIFSDPFTVRKFIVGPPSGVPGWMGKKLNWIFGCDELYIDGRAFAKADGAKWEEEDIEEHPYRGLAINVQEQNRRSSRIFPLNPSVGGKKLLVALNVETEGIADTETGASSNVIQITSVET